MNNTLTNAKAAALNLYNASRELPMPAKQHELMGSSHDVLQQLVNDHEKQAADIDNKAKTIESLNAVIRELEKTRRPNTALAELTAAAGLLCEQIEKSGASPELTKASVMASEIFQRLKQLTETPA